MVFCKVCGKILGSCGVYSGRYIYLLNLIRPTFQYRTMLVEEFKTLSIARPKFLAAGRILIPLSVQVKLLEGAYLDVWKFLEIKIEKYRETSKICIERRFRKSVPTDRILFRRNGTLQTCVYENSSDAINELIGDQSINENDDFNQSGETVSTDTPVPEKTEVPASDDMEEDVNMTSTNDESLNHGNRGILETIGPAIDGSVLSQLTPGPLDFSKLYLDTVMPVKDGTLFVYSLA